MTYICCALYCEAKPLIKRYKLSKVTSDAHKIPFDCFASEDGQIMLVITGSGVVAAASAINALCVKNNVGRNDFVINIGTCATVECDRIGHIYVCNKLTDDSSGRTFYPDMIYNDSLDENSLVTLMKPLGKARGASRMDRGCIYDMEGSGIFQAAMYYMSPDRIILIKVVSDYIGMEVTALQLEKAVSDRLDGICRVVDNCIRAGMTEVEEEKTDGAEYKLFDRMAHDLHCSKVMRDELKQLFVYAHLVQLDMGGVAEKYYEEGKLPCKDKREGKKFFDEIKRELI